MSLQELSILAGQTLGPLVGGYLGNAFGLRIPLFAQAILMAASLAVVLTALPESRWREEETARRNEARSEPHSQYAGSPPQRRSGTGGNPALPPEARQRGALWRLIFSPAFIFVGMFALMIVANRQGARFSVMPLFGRTKGFGPDELGLWISITHFPQFFATLGSGFLSDRFGRKSPIIPSLALICAGIAAFVWADSLWQLLLSGVLLGIGEGLGSPAGTVFFADIAPPGLEGVTIGLLRTFGGAGTIVGAVALGWIADEAGFAWSLWIDALVFAASGIGVILLVRETYQRAP